MLTNVHLSRHKCLIPFSGFSFRSSAWSSNDEKEEAAFIFQTHLDILNVNVSLNWAADICLLQINHPVRLILPGELQNLSAGCLLCRTLANIYNLFLYSEAESCSHVRPQSAASGTVQQNILHYKEWCLIQTVHAKVKVYVEAVWKRGASCSMMFCVNLSRVLIEDLNMQK